VKWDVSGEQLDLNYPHSLIYLLRPSAMYTYNHFMKVCFGQSVIWTLQVVLNFLYLTGTTDDSDEVRQFATKHEL
jgi:hypothetical protein